MSFEIRMSDSVVNTGLDSARFATREEADQAAEVLLAAYPEAGAEVYECGEPATTTFAEWHAAPWGG